jgi:hypothetical protein
MCGIRPASYRRSMDETYRMLGREHQTDLEREARKFRLAAGAARRDRVRRQLTPAKQRVASAVARFAALLT